MHAEKRDGAAEEPPAKRIRLLAAAPTNSTWSAAKRSKMTPNPTQNTRDNISIFGNGRICCTVVEREKDSMKLRGRNLPSFDHMFQNIFEIELYVCGSKYCQWPMVKILIEPMTLSQCFPISCLESLLQLRLIAPDKVSPAKQLEGLSLLPALPSCNQERGLLWPACTWHIILFQGTNEQAATAKAKKSASYFSSFFFCLLRFSIP